MTLRRYVCAFKFLRPSRRFYSNFVGSATNLFSRPAPTTPLPPRPRLHHQPRPAEILAMITHTHNKCIVDTHVEVLYNIICKIVCPPKNYFVVLYYILRLYYCIWVRPICKLYRIIIIFFFFFVILHEISDPENGLLLLF